MNQIDQWQVRKFSDIHGRENISTVRRLQTKALERRSGAAVIVGTMGRGKSTLARLICRSYQCLAPDKNTADPCNKCQGCLQTTAEYNGIAFEHLYYEINGNKAPAKSELIDICDELRTGIWSPLIFVDELQRLPNSSQEVFLDFLDNLTTGLFIATMMASHQSGGEPDYSILPELLDRLTIYHMHPLTDLEMTQFISSHMDEWCLEAPPEVVKELVSRSRGSLRKCLKTLEDARVGNQGNLDIAFLDGILAPLPKDSGFIDPFSH